MAEKVEYPTVKSRTLTLSHDIPISKTKKYWEGLKNGKVYASKCMKCSKVYYPPQADCPKCLTSQMGWIQLSEGEIETFTKVSLKPQGFEQYKEDFVIAIAKTPEGAKVMGWLENADIKNIQPGTHVKITAKTMPDGFPTIILQPT
ncbi:MAG: Zn-ribbon domain-containing OB-fold protein [Candidatus Bathyarchaeia archaeon]